MKRIPIVPQPEKRLSNLLHPNLVMVYFLGLALSLVLLGGIFFLSVHAGQDGSAGSGNFSRELRKFDIRLRETPVPAPAQFNSLLDRLEKKALGVESHLSVLKRRRNLALGGTGAPDALFLAAYQGAAERVAGVYPFSQPLAAIAAESLILEEPVLSEKARNNLDQYTRRLSENRFALLALAMDVFRGNLSDPARAAALPQGGELLSAGIASLKGAEREGFLINAILLKLLGDDPEGALSLVVTLLQNSGEGFSVTGAQSPGPSEGALRFGAEFFYDTGNPLRAAEIFSQFSDPRSMGRLADALWLAGFPEGSLEIWTALASSSPPEEPSPEDPRGISENTPPDIKARSLYNLASRTVNRAQKTAYFEELFTQSPGHIYGVIGYSRLFDISRATGILTETDPQQREPLLDLELIRRRQDEWERARTVAEIWLLLGRHPEDGQLYQWGAYYFDRQRQYTEMTLLIRQARLNRIDGPWLALHEALRSIREGRLEEGEGILLAQPPNSAAWQVSANLGLITESRRSLSTALNYYETAASLVKDPSDAARVQIKIARCLRIMGRDQESRRVLEYALDLDPDNLNAKLELQRLNL